MNLPIREREVELYDRVADVELDVSSQDPSSQASNKISFSMTWMRTQQR